jgi:uncharacterized protein YdiU (UPF0061 family)
MIGDNQNMKKSLKKYTKEAITSSRLARLAVIKADDEYTETVKELKQLLATQKIGNVGYSEAMEEAKRKHDETVSGFMDGINSIANSFREDATADSRLNLDRVDSRVLTLLDNINATADDFQELADAFSDNYTMQRILQKRWETVKAGIDERNRKKRPAGDVPNPHITLEKDIVHFAENPIKNAERFEKFTASLQHTAISGSYSNDYADMESYWNNLGRDFLTNSSYSEKEADTASFDTDFPVERAIVKPVTFF